MAAQVDRGRQVVVIGRWQAAVEFIFAKRSPETIRPGTLPTESV